MKCLQKAGKLGPFGFGIRVLLKSNENMWFCKSPNGKRHKMEEKHSRFEQKCPVKNRKNKPANKKKCYICFCFHVKILNNKKSWSQLYIWTNINLYILQVLTTLPLTAELHWPLPIPGQSSMWQISKNDFFHEFQLSICFNSIATIFCFGHHGVTNRSM